MRWKTSGQRSRVTRELWLSNSERQTLRRPVLERLDVTQQR